MRILLVRRNFQVALSVLLLAASLGLASPCRAQEPPSPYAPLVTKIEPPNWWIHLTPDLMLLVYGHNLQATDVGCNLPQVIVEHTQSSGHGDYLFIWLKIGDDTLSGTLVCRIATPRGKTSFELPLAPRQPIAGRYQGLSSSDVLYLIMPDRFADGDLSNDPPASAPGTYDRSNPRAYHGGDLRGVRDHLSYLKDLGVTALWLTPIVKNGSAQDYHGYGAVDLYAVDPHLGSLADYQDLVSAAHKDGIKIFFDAVPNHVGPLNPWVQNPPLPDWFHGTPQKHLDSFSPVKPSFYGIESHEPIGNDPFEALADPHAPESLRRNLTDGWFFGILPDLNTENPVVQQYLLQNSIWWIESSGLDGFRVDTVPYVSRKFWSGWTSGLHRVYPDLSTFGEVFHPNPEITSFFVGGKKDWDGVDTGLSTVFDYPLFFALRDVLLYGGPAGRIAGILRQDGLYPHPENLVDFFGNHDVPRFSSVSGSSAQKLDLAYGLVLTLRGIPQLYYGDEIGMPGGADPDNRRDFPGGFPGDPKDAFLESGRTQQQQDIFATVRALLHLRREHPALSSGRLWSLFSDDQSYVFLRQTDEEKILVIFNDSKSSRSFDVPVEYTPASGAQDFTLLYGSARMEAETGSLKINAPAESLTIYSLN
ncbi:MAG TPA: alpha-amylase family glycosyl hydrolase [Terriglobales bacterium]|nr:alpha-amylase family glycosyl hydrolase [Terriglobales bacterium]HUL14938.1 alpha-amylase family glycosyl hydrolase [Terriglobales bacterium]